MLVTPAATAHRLTSRAAVGAALSVAIALAVTWLGLALAYYSIYPVGFYVSSLAFGLYVTVRVTSAVVRRASLPRPPPDVRARVHAQCAPGGDLRRRRVRSRRLLRRSSGPGFRR